MNYSLTIKGKPYNITRPLVMGILNCTPDSFYAGSRKQTEQDIIDRTLQIIREGGTMIDVGAMSTRPDGTFVTEEEELSRLRFCLPIVTNTISYHPSPTTHHLLISIDTYRPNVARMAVEEFGVDIINDVGAPENSALHELEHISRDEMYRAIAQLRVPYIIMAHEKTADDTISWFQQEIGKLRCFGVEDIIIDTGYGFGKTISQNYEILARQQSIVDTLRLPLLAGVSRKRMIWQPLGITPDEALNGTTVVNTLALERGAAILRVHDVKEAAQAIEIFNSHFSIFN